MTAKILDGKKLSERIQTRVKTAIAARLQKGLPPPGLAVILVGNDPASLAYVKQKKEKSEAVGISFHLYHLPEQVTTQELEALIDQCNLDPHVHGILLQLPLPSHIEVNDLLERIDVRKDIDGFHPYNLGRLAQRQPLLRPCTSHGVILLLAETNEDLSGKHAVVIGASNIVGRPMGLELLLTKCTVTICHRFTKTLQQYVQMADILVAAIGKPGVIDSHWIKKGAIVIDVGFNFLNGRLVGDLDLKVASQRAGWLTPVPGGVGPVTVAVLLENTLEAARRWDEIL